MQARGLLRVGRPASRGHPLGQRPLLEDRRREPDLRLPLGTHSHGGPQQTIAEQLALVAERPETFEVQFTSSGFGWVVVRLDGVQRDELAELTFEAWRLTAPASLIDRRGDRLPR
jgi:hypothetical protein